MLVQLSSGLVSWAEERTGEAISAGDRAPSIRGHEHSLAEWLLANVHWEFLPSVRARAIDLVCRVREVVADLFRDKLLALDGLAVAFDPERADVGLRDESVALREPSRRALGRDLPDLATLEDRLIRFQDRYNATAIPSDQCFGRAALHDLLHRVTAHEPIAV